MASLNIVVGTCKTSGMDTYRVIKAIAKKVGVGVYEWSFNCLIMAESNIIDSISQKENWLNVKLEDGKIKGSTGALSRFNSNSGLHPLVIVSQLVDSSKRLLGYKVAEYSGSVKNITLKELLAYGERMTKQGEIPIQNAMFIPEEGNKRAYYKAYPNQKFIVEVIEIKRNPNSQEPSRVAVQKNQKNLSKINDIFTPEQIRQLKLGKQSGVDIRIYANTALSWEQMQELRKGLELKVNVRPFASPEYSAKLMKGYVLDSKAGLDIKRYLNPKYNIAQLEEIGVAVEEGLDISKLSDASLSASEMAEIRQRLEAKLWTEINCSRIDWDKTSKVKEIIGKK